MKINYFIVVIISALLFFGAGELPTAGAANFDDPTVKAMHQSVNDMRVKAEKGDPVAQNGLGMISFYGFGGTQDFAAAKGWFEKAANQGYPEAMVQLGNLFENGLGVEKDVAKAVLLYLQAAGLNDPHGQFRLAVLQIEGIGLARDEAEGEKLLRSACDGGYQTSCGVLMWRENKIDEARAVFIRRCESGDQLACGLLAQLGQAVAGEADRPGEVRDQVLGGWGIFLVIGVVLGGLLIFWLLRKGPGDDEEKGA